MGELVAIVEGIWEPPLAECNRIGIIIGIEEDHTDSYYEVLLNNGNKILLHGAYLKRLDESTIPNTT